jgi:hypothetical protein
LNSVREGALSVCADIPGVTMSEHVPTSVAAMIIGSESVNNLE